ncbi:MAG: transposase [Synechococcus sp. SB0678_bin_12]|nr:transposase [Synechococcus sp. SB0678_bin_12]MYI88073.1 transposase [Synechococcus sp. SB0672_bin_10]
MFLEAVFWRVQTGAPWRDLPACSRTWNSQLCRFRRWATRGVLQQLFEASSGIPSPQALGRSGFQRCGQQVEQGHADGDAVTHLPVYEATLRLSQ